MFRLGEDSGDVAFLFYFFLYLFAENEYNSLLVQGLFLTVISNIYAAKVEKWRSI